MTSVFKYLAMLLIICSWQRAICQDEDLQQIHGQLMNYSGKPGPPNFVNNTGIDAGSVAVIKAVLQKIATQIENTPPMNSLTGFNLRVQLSADKPGDYNIPRDKGYLSSVWAAMFHFIRMNGKVVQYSETPAGVVVNINSLFGLAPVEQIVSSVYQSLQMPYFFPQSMLRLTQNAAGYYEMTDRDEYTRIYTNGNPLFIPYTNEQLFTFYARYYEKQAQTMKDEVVRTNNQIEQNKLNPYTGKPFTAAEKNSDSYKITETANHALGESLATYNQQIEMYRRLASGYVTKLSAMNAEQRRSPAHINMNKLDEAGWFSPTDADDADGQSVLTVNPNYFTTSLPKTAVQLIAIKFYGLDRSSTFFLDQLLTRVYDNFDFDAIKKLVQSK